MADTMKAVVMTAPGEYGVQTVEKPKPAQNEVLLKVKAISICGSDPKVFKGDYLPNWPGYMPFIPGHEVSGEVVELGEGVTGFAIGDRVACEAHCGCGTCENCMEGNYNLCLNYKNAEAGHRHYGFTYQGGYAEYAAYSVKSVTKLPDNVSYEEASLADTAGTAYQSVKLAGVVPGGWACIIGPGPIGNFAMQICKALGSKTIMVGRGARLELAGKMGADVTIDYEKTEDVVKAVRDITGGKGVDEAFDCAGTDDSLKQTIYITKKNGNVSWVAMPAVDEHTVPTKTMVMNQITVHGSRANPNVTAAVIDMMSTGMIDAKSMITHEFPIDEIHEAVDTFVGRKGGAMKVLIKP